MAGLSALILGLSWWSQQQALRRQAVARTQSALQHLDEMLRLDLEASQSMGAAVSRWWSEGTLDPEHPEEAARLLLPLLTAQRSITSLNLARADGPSLLFLRLDGIWSMRELIHPGPGAASGGIAWGGPPIRERWNPGRPWPTTPGPDRGT